MKESNLFFVVGFARSGTTMLTSVLGRNPTVCCPPETCFFEHVYRKVGRLNLLKLKKSRFFKDLDLIDFNSSRIKSFCDNNDQVGLLSYGLEQFKDRKKPEALNIFEKSPHHLMYIDTIMRELPTARVIAIVRDPRDVISSLKEVGWAHSSALRHCAEWVSRIKYLKSVVEKYPKNILIVRYEDFLTESSSTLTKISDFTEIEFDETVLAAKESLAIPSWERAWKARAEKGLDKNRIGRYRTVLSDFELMTIENQCHELMSEFGYDVSKPKVALSWSDSLKGYIYKSVFYRNLRVMKRYGTYYDGI